MNKKAAHSWRLFAFAGIGISLAAANQNTVWVIPTATYPFSVAAWAAPAVTATIAFIVAIACMTVAVATTITIIHGKAKVWLAISAKTETKAISVGCCRKAHCKGGSGGESDQGLFHGAFLSFNSGA